MNHQQMGYMVGRKYSQRAVIARLVVGAVFLFGMGLGVGGCAGGGDARPDSGVGQGAQPGASQAEQLYHVMLGVYGQRDLEVDIASDELLLVSSRYENVGPALRRRYVGRVLVLKAGIALNVTAEYQRGSEVDGEQRWRLIEEDDPLKEQATREEVELGRAVERAFHRQKR